MGGHVPLFAQYEPHGLGAASNVELAEDTLDVRGHRFRTYHELIRDLVLPEAFGEQVENLVLSLRKRLELSVRPRAVAVRARPLDQARDPRDQLTGIDRL